MRKRKIVLVTTGFAVISLTILASYSIGKKVSTNAYKSQKSHSQQDESSKYDLLARRLFVDNPNDPEINFSLLRKQIKDYYTTNELSGSIYFEYLPTGTSIRVDGDSPQVGASLIKLPMAMALYKAAELGNVNLDDTYALSEEMLDTSYGDLYRQGAGYSLTLREAAKIMLENSDNTALKLIASVVDGKLPNEQNPFVYADIDAVENNDKTISISARSYGSILKCLYFSCYNEKEDSQEILQRLTNSNFDNRLVAGIADNNLTIAHKIGTFANNTQSDCGIVYYPKRNFMLCVMIKGPDNSATNEHITQISKITFDYINSLPN